MSSIQDVDIGIIGSSVSGLTLAALLQEENVGYSIAIFDNDFNTKKSDGKSIVIGKKASDILNNLSVLPDNSRPINKTFIAFGNGKKRCLKPENQVESLGYAVDIYSLKENYLKKYKAVQLIAGLIENSEEIDNYVLLTTNKKEQYRCQYLIIACELPYKIPPIRYFNYHYKQTVISLTACINHWPLNDAQQSFNSNGVTVVVPRTDDTIGIICCLSPLMAQKIALMTDQQFRHHLSKELKREVVSVNQRHFYTPYLKTTSRLSHRRQILLGQGATVLHPIGAQSIGLGIGDASALSQVIIENKLSEHIAVQYDKMRRDAHRKAVLLTNTLALGSHLRFPIFHHIGQLATQPLQYSSVCRSLLHYVS